jgi:hypothetical protein
LCGVSPLEASSWNTQRRRLNRGGDREANAALYRITLSRLRWDQRNLQRRLDDGKTRRETIRCIKRYIAREIYALLPDPAPQPALDIHRGIGLTGLPEAIGVVWPQAIVQLSSVHTSCWRDGPAGHRTAGRGPVQTFAFEARMQTCPSGRRRAA